MHRIVHMMVFQGIDFLSLPSLTSSARFVALYEWMLVYLRQPGRQGRESFMDG